MSDSKNIPASNLDIVLLVFKSETFVCSVCGEIVFPKVIESDGNVSIETTRAELRGGIGNRLLRGDVCEKCAEYCSKCGHHVNIQSGETTGYCPKVSP